ncbi:MAG: hypothetical protein ACO2O0_03525 [Desulfurococcales archaeon]
MDVEVIGGIDYESFKFLRLVMDAARAIRREYGIEIYVSPSTELFSTAPRKGIRIGERILYIEGEPSREALIEMILDIYRGKRQRSHDPGESPASRKREPMAGSGALSAYSITSQQRLTNLIGDQTLTAGIL